MVDVRAILPHRYPFLMVDRLISQEGDSFEAVKLVTHNEPWAPGHFVEEPVMPGVLIVEALAQASAVALHVREGLTGASTGYLAGIEGARFRRKVVPGDSLRLTGTILRYRHSLCQVEATALVGDEIAATAKLSFVIAR
jgi:3-hydroxyacyl-[acyl-carrier-protein] dehydratase